MPTTLTFRRGTTTQNNSFTGAAGEITVDTTTKTLRVHDNSTAGGEGVVGLTAAQTLTNKTLTSPTINGGTFSGTFTGTISPGQVTTNSIVSNGSNADISIQPSGTGDVLLSALRVNGTTLDSADSTKITIAEALDVTGALKSNTSLALATGATVTGIADQDNMSSDSATLLATQQSVKAYVDTSIAAVSTTAISQGNSNVTVVDSGTGNVTIEVDGTDRITTVAATTTTATGHSLVIGAGSNSAGGQIKFLEGTDNGTNGVTLIGPASTADVTVTLPAAADTLVGKATTDTFTNKTFDLGGTGNSLTGSLAEFNSALQSDSFVSLTGSETLTNKTLTSPTINGGTFSGTFTGDINPGTVTTNNIVSNGSNATISIQPSGTGDVLISALRVNGTTLDSSDSTKVTIAEAVDITGALAVGGAATVSTTLGVTGASTLDGVTITDNTVSTNASNANLELKANGTGGVIITSGGVAFTLPTSDGDDGNVLKTNGSGVLTFASSTTTPSDDTRVVIKKNKAVSTSARTVDYFQKTSADMAWYFIALNDLTNDRSSASCFTVAHNDQDAFVSGPRGGASSSHNTLPSTTADMSSDQVRVKITAPSADSKITYYKIPISRANTSDATAGVTVTTSNTDVDSASETIDSFAHGTYRAAKYTILIDNNAKTETGVIEALVVHDGSSAFITQYGIVNTGNNDMVTLTAQIVSTNVVVSAAGLEPNLSLKIHKTLLSDSMTAVSNANQKIIGATTVSSSATAFDDFDLDDATAAMYYVVGKNASEGHYSVYEVYCAGAPGEASVTPGPYVSTKGTTQLEFTAGFKSGVANSLELSVLSTSGGSTIVNAYRINALAE